MGISIWQVGIVLLIVVLLFGTKKLRDAGGDLGSALKGFKKALNDDDKKDADFDAVENKKEETVSGTVQSKEKVNSKD